MLGVEDLGNLKGVNLNVTKDNISSGGNLWAAEGTNIVHHFSGSGGQIRFLDSIKWACTLVKLVENIEESLGVFQVFSEIFDSLVSTGGLAVVVDPSDEEDDYFDQ